MKRFMKWMSGTFAVMLLLAMPFSKAQAQYDDDYVSYQTFYDDLSPYGQWVSDPQYGNVWVPDVPGDFRPYYTRGYWAMTDYGNTWVSDYPWGWAAFHYGRWTYNPFYGWVWIPGNTWGPAWVSWRWGGGNCGWAPMGPGISLSVSVGNWGCPNDWWVFVGPQYLYSRNFHSYWRGPRYNNTYINNTTIINNTYNNTYVYGPRAGDVERVTHQRVNVHRIANGQPGRTQVSGNNVHLYRPNVRGNASEGRPRGLVQGPREVGKPQSVRNTTPEFRTMVNRGEVRPVNSGRDNRPEQRFDGRQERPAQVRPAGPRENNIHPERQQQRIERPQQMDRPQQRMERPQQMDRSQQRMERPQQMDRPQQRMERPQQMDRPQQRMERPQQMDRPQRMERPQQMDRPQQRMERPQMDRPQQRMERPQPQQQMQRPQQMDRQPMAPRPQPQQQSRPGGDRGGERMGGRR